MMITLAVRGRGGNGARGTAEPNGRSTGSTAARRTSMAVGRGSAQLLLTPGAGAGRDNRTLRRGRTGGGAAAVCADRLPLPDGRPPRRPDRPEVAVAHVRAEAAALAERAGVAAGVGRARRPLVRRPDVLDGGGAGRAGGRTGAAQLPAAPAGPAGIPAGGPLSGPRRARAVRVRHPRPVRHRAEFDAHVVAIPGR